jgi:type 2 lantibiotic biosynthesis protein LanM
MYEQSFQHSAWYKAIPLSERITSLNTVQGETAKTKINTDLAQRRMQKWKLQSPFTNNSCFTQRLAINGITEDQLLSLLGEPIEEVKNRLPDLPDWLKQLAQAFFHPTHSQAEVILAPEKLGEQKEAGFLYIIEPLLSQEIDRLNKGIQKIAQANSHLPFDSSTVVKLLFANFQVELLDILSRTLVLELNVTRLQGLLQGDTPQERFQSFLQRLRQHEIAINLLQEYPVLARQLVISINHWVNFSLEFLQHLCHDWDAICTTFSPETDPGILVYVDSNIGDTHRGGRAVLIAKFSSGFRVVYKPRALSVDVHFQQLLEWLNQRGNHPPFRTLKILNRDTYGWVEFIESHSCTTSEEVERFYERQGSYLAVLYAMEATDFHMENIIAAGEHPILVDLESLFHSRIEANYLNKKSEHFVVKTANYSVLGVGILPQRLWENNDSKGVELSGLGGEEGQLTPSRIQYLTGIGTDEMRVERKQMPMLGSQNRPTLNCAQVNVLNYKDAIIAGFTSMYQLLIKHRDNLLSEKSPLFFFHEDEVRFIPRFTEEYSLLLDESYHPNLLQNALDRDRFFDLLWLGIEEQPHLAKIIYAEHDDLWQGDIPKFTTRPNSRDLWTSSNKKITDFFDQTGMNLVRHRIQQLNDTDLRQQLWFIRASLTTFVIQKEELRWQGWPIHHLPEPKNNASREQLLAAAKAAGDRLEEIALQEDNNISWIGLNFDDEKNHWTLSPLGVKLYSGMPGISLFLAYLGAITQQKHYTKLAKVTLEKLRHQVNDSRSSLTSIGGFTGWGGIIYTLTNLGVLWNESLLLLEAESIVSRLPDLISQDKYFDIIGGVAGCLASLIGLYRCRPSQRTLAAAIQCGEHLITHAQPMKKGVGWIPGVKSLSEKPLPGFSHGASGIALELLELASLTGEKRFHTTALAAIEYERSLFCPQYGTWCDISDFSDLLLADKYPSMTAWCHGAPGVGLARLNCLPYLDNAKIRDEIDIALKSTLEHGFGFNHSLCHGDLGNLELLLQASLVLKDPQWKNQVDRYATIILSSIDRHGWLCGVPLEVEVPGLMTGLAGIGYELLRLAEPELIPSVLVLEPPRLSNTLEKTQEIFSHKSAFEMV